MDAARAAVSKITGRTGHTTDVDEVVNPAVTRETVKPTRHENITQAIDKEVHQDHYHTTVQPLAHREVLPEQHSHQMAAVQNREFSHGDHDGVKRNVAAELGQFKDSSVTHETQHTRSAAPTVAGEHVHHHVHETVQPIIHKETIQPEVVHTTIPIHETHHAAAQHHGMSALPMKSLSEFNTSGGSLTGSQRHTHEEYEGAPRPYNKDLQTTGEKVLGGLTGHHTSGTGVGQTTGTGVGHTSGTGVGHTSGTGLGHTSGTGLGHTSERGVGQTTGSGVGHTTSSSNPLSNTNTTTSTTTSTHTGHHHHSGTGTGANTTGNSGSFGTGSTGTFGTGTTAASADQHHDSKSSGKPSLLDKLNPRKDADGDGKPGFMS